MLNTTAHEICEFVEASFTAERINCERDFPITGLAPSSALKPNSLGFAKRPAPAGATFPDNALVLVDADIAASFGSPRLVVERPRLVFALIARQFSPEARSSGIHPSAVIDPTAKVDETVSIGANTTVGPRVVIGPRTRIAHNNAIGPDVRIGSDCKIGSGNVFGEIGFGVEEYGNDETVRLPHIGGVIIGNRVEIGCLNAIMSGTIDPTVIEDNVQIDNLIHISHNVHIGAGALIIACAEISGSVKIGKRAWIGPNVSIINGAEIGDDCLVGIGSNVIKSVGANIKLVGNPAKEIGTRRS